MIRQPTNQPTTHLTRCVNCNVPVQRTRRGWLGEDERYTCLTGKNPAGAHVPQIVLSAALNAAELGFLSTTLRGILRERLRARERLADRFGELTNYFQADAKINLLVDAMTTLGIDVPGWASALPDDLQAQLREATS